MPAASDYATWANRLDGYRDEMTALVGPSLALARPDALIGGSVSVLVDVTLRAAHANATTVAAHLGDLAAECRARQAICLDYDAAWRIYEGQAERYRQDLDRYWVGVERAEATGTDRPVPPRPPHEPPRPHSWAERDG